MIKEINNPSSINRRNILRTTGALTLGTSYIGTVSGRSSNEYGSVLYSEIGLYHQFDLPSVDGDYLFNEIDDPIERVINEEKDKLHFTSLTNESTKDTFRNNDQVTKFVDYHSIPNTLERTPTREVISELGKAFRRTTSLTTIINYQHPDITIEKYDGEGPGNIVVRSEGKEVIVAPMTSERLRLSSENLKVPVEKSTGKKVQNEDIPKRKRATKLERNEKSLAVKPIVIVRNYGRLEVEDSQNN